MTEAGPLLEGAMITPSIRLVSQLGQGGMGSVWIADHLGLHTQVVVKFMAERLLTERMSLDRFTREAAAAAQIRSPHVAQVFDHGVTAQGIPYIVMELLEGHDLATHLKMGHWLELPQLAVVLAQIAKALGKAHERGIIHRDIKPDNIFLVDPESGEIFVKLLDFGIAKSTQPLTDGHQTSTGAVMGTPYYMSPEQMIGAKHLDHRTDLWSLGVVAYQCLTGRRPFVGETYGALAIAIHGGPPPAPSTVNPSLSPAIDAWFSKACARDPADRFSSARELAMAFAQAAGTAMSTGMFAAQTNPSSFAKLEAAPEPQTAAYPPAFGGQSQNQGQPTTAPVTASTNDPPAPKPRSGSAMIFVVLGAILFVGLGTFAVVFFSGGSKPAAKATAAEEKSEKPLPKAEKEPMPEPSASTEPAEAASASASVEAHEEPPAPSATGKKSPSTKPSAKGIAKPKGKYDEDIK
jgi:serine/threonine-protein kinase